MFLLAEEIFTMQLEVLHTRNYPTYHMFIVRHVMLPSHRRLLSRVGQEVVE